MSNLYEDLVALGATIENRYSDLYTPSTPEALALCKKHDACFSTFTSQIDGKLWIDAAFAYLPYWESKTN